MPRIPAVLCTFLATVLVVVLAGCSSGAKPAVLFGVATGKANGYDLTPVVTFSADARKQVDLVSYFRDFANGRFEPDIAKNITSKYGNVMITLEPEDANNPSNVQPTYSSANVIAGKFDSYLRTFASAVKASKIHIFLRYAHEMNGNWYPWDDGVNGNQPGDYVRAWRHVHDIFTSVGATDVSWVWSPDARTPVTSLSEFYPGNSYVDWLAIDGYNFGGSSWHTPDQIFDPWMAELSALAPAKPVMVAEVGSAEAGGSKAQWITDFFAWMVAHPQVKAFVWSNAALEQDWRIETSASATASFAQGVAASRYG